MINILISVLISAGLLLGALNVPVSWFDIVPKKLGASITTLDGTENLSAFPTTYNANLNSLNNTKLESGSTAGELIIGTTTVGTLTATSTVSFLSALGETSGGTGQSTYTTGDILYASASNVLSKLGIGSAGQSLQVSGGVPAWVTASVNQTTDYNWTGYHTFTDAFFTRATTTNATSTTSHYFPFVTSTLLKTDSAGKLSAATDGTDYVSPPLVYTDFTEDTTAMTTNGTGYSQVEYGVGSFTVAAGDLIRLNMHAGTDTSSGEEQLSIDIGNGTATTTIYTRNQASAYEDVNCEFNFYVNATNSWTYGKRCLADSGNFVDSAIGTVTVELSGGFNMLLRATSTTQSSRTLSQKFYSIEKVQ